ncbi:helix-turn-helix protein [Rhizobium azibense]|nr:helix-turn-helix protein [Rhizobium azibense]
MSHCYLQLTLSDRRRLYQMKERPVGEIARQLGRHRSTIYRELKRNTFHDREFPEYSGYFGTIADDISKERRRRLRKLTRHPALRQLVIDQLKAHWSPEQIAGRLSRCQRHPRLPRNDLSLHLWQGRLSARPLRTPARTATQTPAARIPQAP